MSSTNSNHGLCEKHESIHAAFAPLVYTKPQYHRLHGSENPS